MIYAAASARPALREAYGWITDTLQPYCKQITTITDNLQVILILNYK